MLSSVAVYEVGELLEVWSYQRGAGGQGISFTTQGVSLLIVLLPSSRKRNINGISVL
jgi:hypothetical protein